MTAWEFARGKLRGDYVYSALLTGILPSGATFVDIGCGQGLTLATIVEARRLYTTGQWPASTPPPPTFDRLVGIEMRQRVASIARAALGSDAEIVHAQAPEALPQEISSAALFDVLHLMPYKDQETLLDAIAARMPTGAVLLVRDANANAGSRFRWVRIGNRIKAIAVGRWRQRFFFRDADGWQELFSRHGWRAETVSPAGTVNVLFRLTKA
jgi:SAM-dependent methyltransferase